MSQYGCYREVDASKKTVKQFAQVLKKNGIGAHYSAGGKAIGEIQRILGKSLCAYLTSEPFVLQLTVADALHTMAPAFPADNISGMEFPKQITKARLSDVIYFAVDSGKFPLGGSAHGAYPRIIFEGGTRQFGYKMAYLLDKERARKYVSNHIASMNGSVTLDVRDVDL